MSTINPNKFDALEKQLARDALSKALRDLYSTITQEIERNKDAFSETIEETLENFQENLEATISKTIKSQIDSQLPGLF